MRANLRAHGITLLVLTVVFAALSYWAISTDSGASDEERARALSVASSVVIGPFTGAMARGWQGCCTEFSLWLLPYAAGILGSAVAFQFAPLPPRSWSRRLKLAAWALGVFGWYASGIVSFVHALN